MAFKKVRLEEDEMKGGGRQFEKFNAIGDKYLGVWLRTEEQMKTFNAAGGAKKVKVHTLWWPGGKRTPGGEERPAEEYEITGSFGLDRVIEKAKKPESEGGLGLKDNSGHLVRISYTGDRDVGQASPMKLFDVEADTDYPQNPKAKLPPGFKGGAKPPEDDIPF